MDQATKFRCEITGLEAHEIGWALHMWAFITTGNAGAVKEEGCSDLRKLMRDSGNGDFLYFTVDFRDKKIVVVSEDEMADGLDHAATFIKACLKRWGRTDKVILPFVSADSRGNAHSGRVVITGGSIRCLWSSIKGKKASGS